MKTHEIQLRVRYAETDKMGYCYYGNYPQYFEIGRVEWLRNIGISYKKMEDEGIMLPVVNLQVQYKKPAYYDQLLTVKTTLKAKPSRKIEFDYQIYNEAQELICTAYTALVFVDVSTGKPTLCPEIIANKVATFEY